MQVVGTIHPGSLELLLNVGGSLINVALSALFQPIENGVKLAWYAANAKYRANLELSIGVAFRDIEAVKG